MVEGMPFLGRQAFRERMIREGYTEYASAASRRWVTVNGSPERVVKAVVYFHPDGRVATDEMQALNDGIAIYSDIPVKRFHETPEKFAQYKEVHGFQIGIRKRLEPVLADLTD